MAVKPNVFVQGFVSMKDSLLGVFQYSSTFAIEPSSMVVGLGSSTPDLASFSKDPRINGSHVVPACGLTMSSPVVKMVTCSDWLRLASNRCQERLGSAPRSSSFFM